jgi:hypothetical protein
MTLKMRAVIFRPGRFRRKMLPPFSVRSEDKGSMFLRNVHKENLFSVCSVRCESLYCFNVCRE